METQETKISSRVRVPFTKKKDTLLVKLVKQYGESNWQKVSSFMNNRTVRQCRERWQNSLSPAIMKKDWTNAEDQLLIQKYNIYGPHWKLLESFFIGRTSYSLRNRLNSIKKKLSQKFNYPNNPIKNDDIHYDYDSCNIESFYDGSLVIENNLNDDYFDLGYDLQNQNEYDFEVFH